MIAPDCRCPYCEASINAATGIDDPEITPKAGDFSVCAYCGDMLTFNGKGYWGRLSENTFSTLAPEEKELLAKAHSIVQRLRQER